MDIMQEVDVTRENAFYRSSAREEHIIGKMLKVMGVVKNTQIVTASDIGENKKAFALRMENSIGIIMNPEVVRKSGSGLGIRGKHKTITLSFMNTLGRKQEVKFKGDYAYLIQKRMSEWKV